MFWTLAPTAVVCFEIQIAKEATTATALKMPKKSFFSSSFCCIISFTQFTIVKHFAMSKKAERAKYFSHKSDGYKFLSEQFTAFDDSNGARGLDPNTSDQNSILGIYDKYAIFSPYSRSQFPAGFRRCASKRAIGKFKDRKRFIAEDAKTCKSSTTIFLFYLSNLKIKQFFLFVKVAIALLFSN